MVIKHNAALCGGFFFFLFSYETDKSSFDEPAPESGVLLAIFHEEGDDVPCLETVCVIGKEGEDFSALVPQGEGAPTEAAAPAAEAVAEAAPVAEVTAVAAPAEATELSGAISPRATLRKHIALRSKCTS